MYGLKIIVLCVGPLYDDFRFADMETGDTVFTVVLNDKRENFKYCIYGRENNFLKPLFETDSTKEIVNYFNNYKF